MTHGLSGKAAQVRTLLLDLIETLPEGALLPSERQLAERWQVARMTLRRAMDELVLEEMLVRRHGSGNTTARPKVAKMLAMVSFSEDIRRRGMRPSSRILEFRHLRAEHAIAKRLRIPVGDPVVFFTRLRLADEVPMVVERTTVPAALVPELRAEDLSGSLYALLFDKYGIEVTSGQSKVEPILPDAKTAALLGITQAQPCLSVRGASTDRRHRVCEYTTGVYRGDRYSFAVNVHVTNPRRALSDLNP